MILFIFQVTPLFGEASVSYLYTFYRYDWLMDKFSTYQSVTTFARVIGMTIFIPLIKALDVNETYIMLGTQLTFMARCLIKGLASAGWMYYIGMKIWA